MKNNETNGGHSAVLSTAGFGGWTVPRPSLFRLCILRWTSASWPDNGKGVWQILGFDDMDSRAERLMLRRVMPAAPGGPSGEIILVSRNCLEQGGLRVWKKDLEDPAFLLTPNAELKGGA